ncbi:MAG: hypothetical protein LBI62_06415 [Candidatus Accumulibacter sp.]|nr:hypothetical protein [Accumulibacter sp.]
MKCVNDGFLNRAISEIVLPHPPEQVIRTMHSIASMTSPAVMNRVEPDEQPAVHGRGCNPKWREEVTKNHEPLKTLKAQRKARKAEGISGFLAFDFLCVSVVDRFFMDI